MSDRLHTVHLRVNDAATGQPTPVRLRCTGPDGSYYPPFGRLAQFSTSVSSCDVGGNVRVGNAAYAYVDGACEIHLPAGPVFVEVHKGPEYAAVQREVSLGIGQMSLRLTLERRHNLRAEGWCSGDAGCYFLSPHAALLEGAAEDLAVVNLLALEHQLPEGPPLISNLLAFSGQKPALEGSGCMVVVNTLNQHPGLGDLALLNCHRTVFPLRSGGTGLDDWTLADWCDQCHRKGGLVTWHAPAGPLDGEGPADVVLGKIDALQVVGDPIEPAPAWYVLLDAGFRLPLAGSGGKRGNQQRLGGCRTEAHLAAGEEMNYRNWIEAVRAGRTFVTTGPLLFLTANDQEPGATIELKAPDEKLRVRAQVRNPNAGDRIEVVANGAVAASQSTDTGSATLEVELTMPEGGWLAARTVRPGLPPAALTAHTSPIEVRVQGRPAHAAPEAVEAINAYLARMIEEVRHGKRFSFETDKQREALASTFEHATEVLRGKAARIG